MSSAQRITPTGHFHSQVAAVSTLSPQMRRLVLRAADTAATVAAWPLACDIAIVLAGDDGREVRRRYTVRTATTTPDGQVELTVDALLHGHGPGSTWAETAQVGDEVTFIGPRGRIDLTGGPLLALTDESGLPAIAAVADSLAPGQPLTVLAEVAEASARYPLPDHCTTVWLPRDGRPAGSTETLLAGLAHLTEPEDSADPADPADVTDSARDLDRFAFAYVITESRAAVSLREELTQRGLARDRIYAKGYWNLNSRSTR